MHRMTRTERDAVAVARAIYDVPEERRLGALALALRMAIEGGWLERVSPSATPRRELEAMPAEDET